ncbi:hypothetical protein EVAR_93460_1 [Eumeta japonica]|uniref:Uncharacterized protein n=1 Tax=Eumeta variegata TaxID=151549 RepID=A0A4C1TMC3_EUMVA|nr:hypothetical protein EVAR_93460_1 [Eumeta japonica]
MEWDSMNANRRERSSFLITVSPCRGKFLVVTTNASRAMNHCGSLKTAPRSVSGASATDGRARILIAEQPSERSYRRPNADCVLMISKSSVSYFEQVDFIVACDISHYDQIYIPRQKTRPRLALLKIVAALHHSWTSATSGLRGLFLITCRQNFLRGLFLITNFFVCEAPSGARPSAVADVADA